MVAGAKRLLRSFGTATRELEVPRAWLAKHGVTYAGTERPGRKFDVKDAEWIAQLVPLHSGFDGLSVSGIERGQVGAVHLDGDAPSCAGVA